MLFFDNTCDTTGFIREDTDAIRDIPDTGEDEKQDADALGAFAVDVEEDLRQAGSEI